MKYSSVFKSKKDQKGQTPDYLLDMIYKKFNHGRPMFDPAPANWNIKIHGDGLKIPWKKSNFINPPFDDTGKWFEKAIKEANKGNTSVFLIPCRFHTKYFHDAVKHINCIYLINERIKFKGYNTALPLALCLVVFGPHVCKPTGYLSFARIPQPGKLYQIKQIVSKYTKDVLYIKNSISEPMSKLKKYPKIIFSPSRLDNRDIKKLMLKQKQVIFLNPTLKNKDGTRMVEGSALFDLNNTNLHKDNVVHGKVKYSYLIT